MQIEQRQTWPKYTRWLIANECGSVQLELWPSVQEDFGGTAFIYALWVEPQARRKGEAKKLLERAEDIAREAGHKAVRLEWHDYTPKEILYWYMRNGYDDKAFDGMGKYVLLEKILQP